MILKEMIYLNKVLKNIIKLSLILIITFSLIISLNGCKEKVDFSDETNYTIFPEAFIGCIKEKKIYVTSIGQAIDANYFYENVKNLDDFDIRYNSNLTNEDIQEDTVVFVVVGCSIKGLTEAGTDISQETIRANKLIEDAKLGKYTLISWHTGGMSRRGYTSDTLIELMFANSDLDIYIKAGNTDNFLTDVANKKNIPICEMEYFANIKDTIYLLLGKDE